MLSSLLVFSVFKFPAVCSNVRRDNPDAVSIRNQRSAAEVKANYNPIKRIENAYTQSGRIANPPERPNVVITFGFFGVQVPCRVFLLSGKYKT